jgi:hypothetical protein
MPQKSQRLPIKDTNTNQPNNHPKPDNFFLFVYKKEEQKSKNLFFFFIGS